MAATLQQVVDVLNGSARCPVSRFLSYSGDISVEQLQSLAAALHANNQVAGLRLKGCSLGDSAATELANAISRTTALTTLELPGNRIGSSGAKDLAAALATNASLTALDLSGNPCEHGAPQAMRSISSALQRNRLQARTAAKTTPTPVRRASARTPQPARALTIEPTSVTEGLTIEDVAPETPTGVCRTPELPATAKRTPGIPKARPSSVLAARQSNENSQAGGGDGAELEYRLQQLESSQAALGSEVEAIRGLGSQLEAWKAQMDQASTQVASVLTLVEKDASQFRAQFSDLQAWRTSVDALSMHVGGALQSLQGSTQQLQLEMRKAGHQPAVEFLPAQRQLDTWQQDLEQRQAAAAAQLETLSSALQATKQHCHELAQQVGSMPAEPSNRLQLLECALQAMQTEIQTTQQQLAALADMAASVTGMATAPCDRLDALEAALQKVQQELHTALPQPAVPCGKRLDALEAAVQEVQHQLQTASQQPAAPFERLDGLEVALEQVQEQLRIGQQHLAAAADTVTPAHDAQAEVSHMPQHEALAELLARLDKLEEKSQRPAPLAQAGLSPNDLLHAGQPDLTGDGASLTAGAHQPDALDSSPTPAATAQDYTADLAQRLKLLETKVAALGSSGGLNTAGLSPESCERLPGKAASTDAAQRSDGEVAKHSRPGSDADDGSPAGRKSTPSLQAHPLSPMQSSTHTSVEGDVTWWQNEQLFRRRTPVLTQTASPVRRAKPQPQPSQSLFGLTEALGAGSPRQQLPAEPDTDAAQRAQHAAQPGAGSEALAEVQQREEALRSALERESQRGDRLEAQLRELTQIIPRLQVEMLGMKQVLAERQSPPLPTARHPPAPTTSQATSHVNTAFADSLSGNFTHRLSALAAAMQATPRVADSAQFSARDAPRDFMTRPLSASRPTPRIGQSAAPVPTASTPVMLTPAASLPNQPAPGGTWVIKAGHTSAAANSEHAMAATSPAMVPFSSKPAARPSSAQELPSAGATAVAPVQCLPGCSPEASAAEAAATAKPQQPAPERPCSASTAASTDPEAGAAGMTPTHQRPPQPGSSPHTRSPAHRELSASPSSAYSSSVTDSPLHSHQSQHTRQGDATLTPSPPRYPWLRSPTRTPPTSAAASSKDHGSGRPAVVPALRLRALRGSPESASYKPTQMPAGLAVAAAADMGAPDAVSPLMSLRSRVAQRKAISLGADSVSSQAGAKSHALQHQQHHHAMLSQPAASPSTVTSQAAADGDDLCLGPIQDAHLDELAVSHMSANGVAGTLSASRTATAYSSEIASAAAGSPPPMPVYIEQDQVGNTQLQRPGREISQDWSEQQTRVRSRKAGSLGAQPQPHRKPPRKGSETEVAQPVGVRTPLRPAVVATPVSKPRTPPVTPLSKVSLAGPGRQPNAPSPQATPVRQVTSNPVSKQRPRPASASVAMHPGGTPNKTKAAQSAARRPASATASQQPTVQADQPKQAPAPGRKPTQKGTAAGATAGAQATSPRQTGADATTGSAPAKRDDLDRILRHDAKRPASNGKPKSAQSRLRRLFRL